MGEKNVADELLLDDDLIEKGFNDALEDLQKSLNPKPAKARTDAEDEPEEEEETDDEDTEDEDDEKSEYRKSVEDILNEEPEAAAAMDVEPYLLQLAKAIDESIEQVARRIAGVEKLVKSQATLVAASAQLQKSMRDMVKSIGEQPVNTNSVRRLIKSSRFSADGEEREVDNAEVLIKSREWLRKGSIDIIEAGKIEGRINKNLLFKSNDALDQKVATLVREAS